MVKEGLFKMEDIVMFVCWWEWSSRDEEINDAEVKESIYKHNVLE